MVADWLSKDITRRLIALLFCMSIVASHFAGIVLAAFGMKEVASFTVPGRELTVIVVGVIGFYFGGGMALKKPGEDTDV